MRFQLWLPALAAVALPSASRAWFEPGEPNEIEFSPVEARFVRLLIPECASGEPCLDELEVYGPGGGPNLALASAGARASASSLLPGHAIHQVPHLNDGLYGNGHSWIAGGSRDEWAAIELPRSAPVAKVAFSRDREGRFADRVPDRVEVQVSLDGSAWRTVARANGAVPLPATAGAGEEVLRYAFAWEQRTWRKVDPASPLRRVLDQLAAMIERLAKKGVDVTAERAELARLLQLERGESTGPASIQGETSFPGRLLKRRLFLRDPDLAGLERVLFVKRQPYAPSHNYSDLFDPAGAPGGAVCLLELPQRDGRLEPERARLISLHDAGAGVVRDPAASFDARSIYFSWRPTADGYFHLYRMDAGGGGLRQITDGPFHDIFPCPLPDGGLALGSGPLLLRESGPAGVGPAMRPMPRRARPAEARPHGPPRRGWSPRLLSHAHRRRLGALLRLRLGTEAPAGATAQLRGGEEQAARSPGWRAPGRPARPGGDLSGEVLDRPQLPALARLPLPAGPPRPRGSRGGRVAGIRPSGRPRPSPNGLSGVASVRAPRDPHAPGPPRMGRAVQVEVEEDAERIGEVKPAVAVPVEEVRLPDPARACLQSAEETEEEPHGVGDVDGAVAVRIAGPPHSARRRCPLGPAR